MDEEKFNMSLRKFLKQVGVTSQQQIERAVRESGKTDGAIAVKVVLSSQDVDLNHVVEGEIELD